MHLQYISDCDQGWPLGRWPAALIGQCRSFVLRASTNCTVSPTDQVLSQVKSTRILDILHFMVLKPILKQNVLSIFRSLLESSTRTTLSIPSCGVFQPQSCGPAGVNRTQRRVGRQAHDDRPLIQLAWDGGSNPKLRWGKEKNMDKEWIRRPRQTQGGVRKGKRVYDTAARKE